MAASHRSTPGVRLILVQTPGMPAGSEGVWDSKGWLCLGKALQPSYLWKGAYGSTLDLDGFNFLDRDISTGLAQTHHWCWVLHTWNQIDGQVSFQGKRASHVSEHIIGSGGGELALEHAETPVTDVSHSLREARTLAYRMLHQPDVTGSSLPVLCFTNSLIVFQLWHLPEAGTTANNAHSYSSWAKL